MMGFILGSRVGQMATQITFTGTVAHNDDAEFRFVAVVVSDGQVLARYPVRTEAGGRGPHLALHNALPRSWRALRDQLLDALPELRLSRNVLTVSLLLVVRDAHRGACPCADAGAHRYGMPVGSIAGWTASARTGGRSMGRGIDACACCHATATTLGGQGGTDVAGADVGMVGMRCHAYVTGSPPSCASGHRVLQGAGLVPGTA